MYVVSITLSPSFANITIISGGTILSSSLDGDGRRRHSKEDAEQDDDIPHYIIFASNFSYIGDENTRLLRPLFFACLSSSMPCTNRSAIFVGL